MAKIIKCDSCGQKKVVRNEFDKEYFVACMAKDPECCGSVFYCCHCIQNFLDHGYQIRMQGFNKRVVLCSDDEETEEVKQSLNSLISIHNLKE